MLHLEHATIEEILFNTIDASGGHSHRIELDANQSEQQIDLLLNRISKSFANQQLMQFSTQEDDNAQLGALLHQAIQSSSLVTLQAEHALELQDQQLKPGQDKGLLFILLKNIAWEDEMMHGLALFALQDKDLVLRVDAPEPMRFFQGLVLDKAPLSMLLLQAEGSFENKILINASKNDTASLVAHFQLESVPNSFYKTSEMIQLTNAFVKHKFEDEELDKLQETEVMYRSKTYFDNVEQFDQNNYSNEVFQNEQLSSEFEDFVEAQTQSLPAKINLHSFSISDQAVNKQKRIFKSVIKLDKNFHIYVHGDRNKITKGTDSDGRKFYQIYYDEEH